MDKELPISFDALRNKVFRHARRIVHDAEDAIVQDVFEKIWNMQKQARLTGNIEALAMTISKNIC